MLQDIAGFLMPGIPILSFLSKKPKTKQIYSQTHSYNKTNETLKIYLTHLHFIYVPLEDTDRN